MAKLVEIGAAALALAHCAGAFLVTGPPMAAAGLRLNRPALSPRGPLAFHGGINRADQSSSDAHAAQSVMVVA
ncbi:unnamed protein product, partial [Laminaria digitata]